MLPLDSYSTEQYNNDNYKSINEEEEETVKYTISLLIWDLLFFRNQLTRVTSADLDISWFVLSNFEVIWFASYRITRPVDLLLLRISRSAGLYSLKWISKPTHSCSYIYETRYQFFCVFFYVHEFWNQPVFMDFEKGITKWRYVHVYK